MKTGRCHVCTAADASAAHVRRCETVAAAMAKTLAHAEQLDRTPEPRRTTDLVAHLNTRLHEHDVQLAAELARVVLDLGWRPTVGADR